MNIASRSHPGSFCLNYSKLLFPVAGATKGRGRPKTKKEPSDNEAGADVKMNGEEDEEEEAADSLEEGKYNRPQNILSKPYSEVLQNST